ncbi:MAG: class I SAM-dependent methyltransferase [Bryobacteraceae bacterium]
MKSNWETDFFRGVVLELWRRVMTPEQTRAEVEFLERALRIRPQAQLLDVPCGNGRHALEFANRGHSMTGVDLSEEFIAEVRSKSASPARWMCGDMCELPWISKFDGAYCFGNSFGYLDRANAGKFLGRIARALKPNGRFAVETGMAAESILPALLKTRWFKAGDIFMLSENQYYPAEGRLDIGYTFIQGGAVDTRPSSSYVFTVAEICRMHAEAGLEPLDLLGSIAGEPFQLGSQRLILICEKS